MSGNLTLNGITDQNLITILEVKTKHPALQFAPNTLQPAGGSGPAQTYNGATFSWQNDDGLRAVIEILQKLVPPK